MSLESGGGSRQPHHEHRAADHRLRRRAWEEHTKELHLIVASRDLTVFRHPHPRRAADGTWSAPVTPTVTRNGEPVRDLQPYLGAYGHLVTLRSGDLGCLHVHPNGEPGDGTTPSGPDISFTTTAPGTGIHRLLLDFQHAGEVHTAAFTVRAGRPARRPDASTPPSPHPCEEPGKHSGHGH